MKNVRCYLKIHIGINCSYIFRYYDYLNQTILLKQKPTFYEIKMFI